LISLGTSLATALKDSPSASSFTPVNPVDVLNSDIPLSTFAKAAMLAAPTAMKGAVIFNNPVPALVADAPKVSNRPWRLPRVLDA
jgi:hypothetical protein